MLVQIYVDDIIFGSTNEKLCKRFAKFMQNKFEMNMTWELNYLDFEWRRQVMKFSSTKSTA